jgi:REP element-mobilizing transposase RayT
MMTRTRYKILPGDQNPYFLTSTTVNWLPLFKNPEIAQIIIDSLIFMASENRLTIYAYVLMENHLHLIASAENLGNEIASFKSFTARKCIDNYKENRNVKILQQLSNYKLVHRKDRSYQFWQEGVHPKRIIDNTMMQQKINYIHHNPVRKGYVDKPELWLYSSARDYSGETGLLEIFKNW